MAELASTDWMPSTAPVRPDSAGRNAATGSATAPSARARRAALASKMRPTVSCACVRPEGADPAANFLPPESRACGPDAFTPTILRGTTTATDASAGADAPSARASGADPKIVWRKADPAQAERFASRRPASPV